MTGTDEVPAPGSVDVRFVKGSKEGSKLVVEMRIVGDPEGRVLTFTPDEWKAFTLGVHDGEFDLPG